MGSDLVTIAIASYNNASYIERCVESVINQTYSNLEILIIDDGSTDDTIARIQKYSEDYRVRVIRKENGGLSSVRQLGLDEAKGDFICFIDADDYILPTYVEYMLGKLIQDKSDVCVCSTRFESIEGKCLDAETAGFKTKTIVSPVCTTPDVISKNEGGIMGYLFLSDSWNKMYRVSTIRDTGVNFCMLKGLNGSDTLFNEVLALHGLQYSLIDDTGYVHIIYPSSAVHRKNKNLKKSFEIIIGKMIDESKALGNFEILKDNFSTSYFIYQVAALTDLYESRNNMKSFYEAAENAYHDYLLFKECKKLPKLRIKSVNFEFLSFYLMYSKIRYLLPTFFVYQRFKLTIKDILYDTLYRRIL